ncbi:hypothetical protein VNO77_45172 [Canavalia gladiata]|uniref:Uncharacterized protein n=1 Tax=Canavalia gladiata TaxID=3824 RepID=A0AAN9JU04_CANGL
MMPHERPTPKPRTTPQLFSAPFALLHCLSKAFALHHSATLSFLPLSSNSVVPLLSNWLQLILSDDDLPYRALPSQLLFSLRSFSPAYFNAFKSSDHQFITVMRELNTNSVKLGDFRITRISS